MTLASGFLVSYIDERLRSELWDRIARRLSEGDSLVTRRQFCAAIEAAYLEFTGAPPSAEVRSQLERMVEEVHSLEPEAYLAPGVQNAVMQAFGRGVTRLDWDVVTVESYGTPALQRFLGRDRVRDLFDEIRLDPGLIDLSACVRHGAACARPAGTRTTRRAATASPGRPARPALDRGQLATFLAAATRIGLEEAAVRERMEEQSNCRSALMAPQVERASADLALYVQDGHLNESEAAQYRELRAVDDRLGASAISPAEAGQQRDDILDANGRRALDRKVERAVSRIVDWLQVFQALQSIPRQYDGLLQLLIRHSEHVLSSDTGGDRTPLLSSLLGNAGLLEQAVALMEHRDPELRLLAVRLPPYNQAVPRKLEPVSEMQIEESFLDDLRRLTPDQYAERLRDADPDRRRRAVDDIRSFIFLVDSLVEPTPFRRKIRLLQVNQLLQELTPEIESTYRRTDDLTEARRAAARLVRQRLDRAFGQSSPDEEAAARKRCQAVLITVEQKTTAERPDALQEGEEQAEPVSDEAEAVTELTAVEERRGAQLVRVEVRAGGRPRVIPSAIMPDPDDSRRFVMARRDPGSGELIAQQRRGRNRYVERQQDGTWRALTG